MENKKFVVLKYTDEYADAWDVFIKIESVNGTFLQTRRFLEYHPYDRFTDSSYLVLDDKKRMIAVVPACEMYDGKSKILISHAGSTYGGIIVGVKYYSVIKLLEIMDALEKQWKNDCFDRIILKQTPSMLSVENADLFEYCYYKQMYTAHNELNLYIDFANYNENILSALAQGKRTNVHNCQKRGLVCRQLSTYNDVKTMHHLLEITLEKYNKKPVHTIDELYDFMTLRLKDECALYGVFEQDNMLSASMMFFFDKANVAHTQYLVADPAYNQLSPMTYMYYCMICEMRKLGYDKLTWGIVTEDNGRYLNEGLAKSKAAYGSKYSINQVFEKDL